MPHHRTLTSTIGGSVVVAKRAASSAGAAAIAAEAERLDAASHPGVVRLVVRSHGPHEGFATAWVSAHTLQTFAGPLADGLRVASSVCDTLADLHARGIVHGRLDPTHVIVADGARAVLCGFGPENLASPTDDIAAVGGLLSLLAGQVTALEPIPERRWTRRHHDDEMLRRTVQTLADQATSDDPDRRPSAAALGRSLAMLASPASGHPAHRPETLQPGWRPRRVGPRRPLRPVTEQATGTEALDRATRWLVVTGLLVVAAVGGVILADAARLILSDGPGLSGSSAGTWLGNQDTVSVMAFMVEISLLLACAYLVTTTVLAAIGRLVPSTPILRFADAATPRLVRSAVARVAGISLSATVLLAAGGRLRAPAAVPAAAATPEVTTPAVTWDDPEEVATGGAPTPEVQSDPSRVPTPRIRVDAPDVPSEPATEAPALERTWTVQRGDHLWGIAESICEQALGRSSSEAETAALWREILLANAELDDPDVLRPGQVISIPAR